MKKTVVICMALILSFLLVGCGGDKYKAYSNYSENEVFDLVNSYLAREIHGSGLYDLKIIKTEPLEVCTLSLNVCQKYKTVKGANRYTVELTNKRNGRREAHVIVEDRYYKNSELITPKVFSENFHNNYKYYERYDKLIALLSKYNSIKYTLIDDEIRSDKAKTVQYGYIYSTNIFELEDFLNTISRSQYEYYWDFIITNNINEYNNLINDQHSFEDILAKYEKTNVVYHVDLTSFNSNSSAIIENTSQGSSTCVNSVLIKK